ncbi:MAG: DUF1553 domain-containing protein [Verrucomicrobiota bacterium]
MRRFCIGVGVCVAMGSFWEAAAEIDFARDIRPILSDNCFHCHGPDGADRKADLRLDTEEGAKADLGGYFAVVAGKPEESLLLERIFHDDPNELMPPDDSERVLSPREKDLLQLWIEEGAKWEGHWAFEPVERPEVPEIIDADSGLVFRNEIDAFVRERLLVEGMELSEEAERAVLIRRVTLDLTGLPPSPEEVDAFLTDETANAYEKVVDRLLASPHYGERMAQPWLDAARYADSAGYQNDFMRTQWPWRDWVIGALNDNMPFDRFTIEQLAGDLLPGATDGQILATAFNRNHRINNEGGIIPEEFLVEYVSDRVETTSTVWLGLTAGCARCHDHKYDPISQRDFFQLFAFFHNVPEKGKDGAIAPEPNMAVYRKGAREKHEELERELIHLREQAQAMARAKGGELETWKKEEKRSIESGVSAVRLSLPTAYYAFDYPERNRVKNLGGRPADGLIRGTKNRLSFVDGGKHGKGVQFKLGGYMNLGKFEGASGYSPTDARSHALWVKPGNDLSNVEGPLLSRLTPDKQARGFQIVLVDVGAGEPYRLVFRLNSDRGKKEGIEVMSTEPVVARGDFSHVAVTYDGSLKADGVKLYVNGEAVAMEVTRDNFGTAFSSQEELLLGAETESSPNRGIRDELLANTVLDDVVVFREELSPGAVAFLQEVAPAGLVLVAGRTSAAGADYLEQVYFQEHDPEYQRLLGRLSAKEQEEEAFGEENITYVSVMKEMEEPRDTYLLLRGAYDQPDTSEVLQPATFEELPPMASELSRDRLGLAQWLVSPENPLTARVTVNRYWQHYFGTGLVKTSEDFGSQGEPPSHPELLDWLAAEFVESGWDVKAMQKLIVTSATYRQSSKVNGELLEKDPENRLLARGPRYRLDAFAMRDQALAASGQLAETMGGPPVMPYQPEGLWEEVSAKGFKYEVGEGEDLYRRSLYTFWRRTVPPPSMMNFDTATREFCSVKSNRTNTPLQAMNLMNDPQYVEAARKLAERMMREGGGTVEERLGYGMKLVLGREPDEAVMGVLSGGYRAYFGAFEAEEERVTAFLGVGEAEVDPALDAVELAAYAAVASVILNLDETVTKE